MSQPQPQEDNSSPLSSEFEDLGLADVTPSTSKSTGLGESDWTEGGEVNSASRSGYLSGSAPQVRALAPAGQTMAVTEYSGQEAAAPHGGAGASRTPGEPDDKAYSTLKEIEQAGSAVADFTKHAASDLTKKLFGGGGGESSSAEDSFSIKGIAEGVSSWWSNLDPAQLVPDVSSGGGAASSVQAKTDAQQLFGLPATEELLEKFACTLVQNYSCGHNAFTGPREVTWRGVLYITDRHSCWKAEADSTTLMLPHGDVASVEKTAKGVKGSLRVAFGHEGEFLVLRGFGKEEDLDGALALLEHVTGTT